MLELITDQTFNLNRTKEYKLSIQVSLDGFSFSVVQSEEDRLLALKSIPVNISSEKFLSRRFEEWFHSEEILAKAYAVVEIYYFTRRFTLIPEEYFQFEKQNEIANLLFENKNSNQLFHNHLGKLNTNLIATIPADLVLEFDKVFDKYSLFHTGAGILQKSTEKFSEGVALILDFYRESFAMNLFEDGKLLMTNSYNFRHPNDVLYYIMAVLKQHQIQPANCRLALSGAISAEEEKEKLLRKYFEKTEYLSPEVKRDPEKFNLPMHNFMPLI